jgi:predicted small metal-binding protein
MAEGMKKLECSCDFMVRSHDEEEIVRVAKEHAEKYHKMSLSDEQAKALIEPA